MDDLDPEWQRKGATLSDKTARKEFGLTQDQIVQAIRACKLHHREASMHGNPWVRLLLKAQVCPCDNIGRASPRGTIVPISEVRAYFTRFDRATFANADWHEEDLNRHEADLALELKLLALLKGRVVVAASHLLESELARTLILKHPEVISDGIIIPALRDDCPTVGAFLDLKLNSAERAVYRRPEVRDVQQIIDNASVDRALWSSQRTMAWFHHRLCTDIAQPFSVLRSQMPTVSQETADVLQQRLGGLEDVSRQAVLGVAREVLGSPSVPYTEYVDFLYYLSGAIAVRAEGVLPQENLVRFDVATDEHARERLSDMEIFYRVFMRIVREHTRRALPREVLGELSFEDIAALRRSSLHLDFVKKYQGTLEQAKERTTISDPEQLVLRAQEMEALEWELFCLFTDTIAHEVREKVKGRREKEALELLGSVTSVVPVYHSAKIAIELTSSALGFAAPENFKHRLVDVETRLWGWLDRIVDRRDASERAVLLRFLGQVVERYRRHLPEV